MLPAEARPTAWSEAAELQRTAEFAHLVLTLARLLGDTSPLTLDVLAGVAADPQPVIDALTRSAEDEHGTQRILELVGDYLRTSEGVVRQLLTLDLDDPDAIDGVLLREAATWFDTGQRLLQHLLGVALGSAPQVAS